MAGTLSKGVKLYIATIPSEGTPSWGTALANLQEFPDLLGEPETVDVTTLDDDFRHYILGIQDVGGVMNFTFLYEKTVLSTLNGYKGVHKAFKVEFPDGVNFTWEGYCAPSVVGKGVNDALQINLGVVADTDIDINFPTP